MQICVRAGRIVGKRKCDNTCGTDSDGTAAGQVTEYEEEKICGINTWLM
jgi:hypothetical protein